MVMRERSESFWTGVNIGVFGGEIVDRMNGTYMNTMFKRLRPFIDERRTRFNHDTAYIEFEGMCLEIQRIRTEKGSSYGKILHC